MESSPIISWQIDGETMKTVTDYFLRPQNHCRWWLQPWNSKTLTPWKKSYDNLDSISKTRDITLPTMVRLVKAMVFSSSQARMWELGHKEGWDQFKRTDAFELWFWIRLLRIPWTARRSNQSNQPWIFIGRTDAEGEAPVLWPPDAKSQLIGKDPEFEKDWR